ncbi:uncharacterized protein An07g04630 [Aspergillus niger]|uniref:Contig An07c0120, genomic contig n=2 Tax=Aspergillus niger TaxID=5061 RepID=A2QN72_ASPNC|nr:uncharacterized protein An07g04630 [Aspergillus niger]CAK39381.1 unnamed protein product [Aspergillus niger]
MALTATGIAGKASDLDESQHNARCDNSRRGQQRLGMDGMSDGSNGRRRRAARDITATGSSSGLSFAERQQMVAPSMGWKRAREGTRGGRGGGATGAIRAGRLETDSEGPTGSATTELSNGCQPFTLFLIITPDFSTTSSLKRRDPACMTGESVGAGIPLRAMKIGITKNVGA